MLYERWLSSLPWSSSFTDEFESIEMRGIAGLRGFFCSFRRRWRSSLLPNGGKGGETCNEHKDGQWFVDAH